ncbi:carbohydrate esterase family 16 protein [Tulasnella calospora MUT 4182]|uniref:Carbohydrate esterase family 16 protein n=1 Tax=Tulasnella calospora MUT 4182 TaxID=1051891 RepID=A0A0C3QHQ4_9AGAM|nr:carbohydrate esterase family 16 protein [Tulasnella calospora MUT 4182]
MSSRWGTKKPLYALRNSVYSNQWLVCFEFQGLLPSFLVQFFSHPNTNRYSQCLPQTVTTTTTTTTTRTTSTTSQTSSTTSVSTSSSPTTSATPGSQRFWFSFGDSYTATGFDIGGTKPNSANVFGNPAYPGNTACGTVTNWIDEMVVRYNESPIYAYNFAISGATIDNSIVPAFSTSIKSVTEQVGQFISNLGSKPSYAPWTSSTAIFSFFIGINDIGMTFCNSYTQGDRTDTLLTAYFNQVQKLYDAGGRNFLFVNVPPVDRSPLMISQSSASTEKNIIISYNTKLASKIQAFKSAHSDVTTYLYDSWSKLTQILNSPQTYGLQDATSQGSGSNVAWCNVYHVSPAVHHLFAQDIQALLAGSGF